MVLSRSGRLPLYTPTLGLKNESLAHMKEFMQYVKSTPKRYR